jgi:hypothetical protein
VQDRLFRSNEQIETRPSRCRRIGRSAQIAIPEHIRDFVTNYSGPDRQLTLRLGENRSGMSRNHRFFDPIELSGRKPLVTLRDAAQYIIKLPKVERDIEEW